MTDEGQQAAHSAVYFGQVMHARLQPLVHRFRYRVFSFLIDLDELGTLGRRSLLFSHNRWNLFSFWDRDHGPKQARGKATDLRGWIAAQLSEHGLEDPAWQLRVLCFPRVLGFVFNPLSVWFCHRQDGRLAAVLYEVHNTFGERHGYLIPLAPSEDHSRVRTHHCRKGFYVSPFMDMEAVYRFNLRPPGKRVALAIHQSHGGRPQMTATLAGTRAAFSDRSLLTAFFRNPLLTWKVVGAIHWQAVKLWLKGAKYHKRPPPPDHPVTLVPATQTADQPAP